MFVMRFCVFTAIHDRAARAVYTQNWCSEIRVVYSYLAAMSRQENKYTKPAAGIKNCVFPCFGHSIEEVSRPVGSIYSGESLCHGSMGTASMGTAVFNDGADRGSMVLLRQSNRCSNITKGGTL